MQRQTSHFFPTNLSSIAVDAQFLLSIQIVGPSLCSMDLIEYHLFYRALLQKRPIILMENFSSRAQTTATTHRLTHLIDRMPENVGRFPQKSHQLHGSFAENDLEREGILWVFATL